MTILTRCLRSSEHEKNSKPHWWSMLDQKGVTHCDEGSLGAGAFVFTRCAVGPFQHFNSKEFWVRNLCRGVTR